MKGKIFAAGFILGAILTFIPKTQIYLRSILSAFYPYNIPNNLLALIWGILFGAILVASRAILDKEGRIGLLRIAVLIGFLVMAFWLVLTTNLL